jgi:uncharacterized protein YegP (UPF0339 family)
VTFKVLKTSTGNWFWHLIASNGRKVATAGESFSSKDAAKTAAENVERNAGAAGLEVEDQ